MSSPAQPAPGSAGLSKRVFVGTFWILTGRILSILVLAANSALLSRGRLTDDEFGVYIMALFLIPFFGVLSNLATNEILMREVRASLVVGNSGRARRATIRCFFICGAASVVVGIAIVAILSVITPTKPLWILVKEQALWIALWNIAQTASQIAGEACRGANAFGWSIALYTKTGGWVSNALSAAVIFAMSPYGTPMSLTSVMVIQAVTTALPVFLGTVVLRRKLADDANPLGVEATGLIEGAEESELPEPTTGWFLRESWPILISYVVIIGIEQLDVFVVGLFASGSDVADYGVAKQLLSVVNFLFVSLAPAITPFVAELYWKGDLVRLQKLMRGAATIVAAPTIAVSLFLFIAASPIVIYGFGPQRAGVVETLRVLLIGQMILSLAGHSYLALSMSGHQKQLMHSSLLVGAVYLVIGPAATYYYGTVGAGAAKSIAAATRAVFASILVYRTLGIWTMASLSPAVLQESFGILFTRLKRTIGRRPTPAPADSTQA